MQFRFKLSLRLLLIAVTLAPVPIWGVYRWRVNQLKQQALVRLDQASSGRTSGGPVYGHLSLDPDSPLINITLDGKRDPHQLLNDCLASSTRIHKIEIGDQCLVDISLAQRIASLPKLNELEFWHNAQVEPEAWPLLLNAAYSIGLSYQSFQRLVKDQVKAPTLEQLEILSIPPSELIGTLQSGAKWKPASLVAHLAVQNINDETPMVAEGTLLRQQIDTLQIVNPEILIRVGYRATPPVYKWQDELVKAKFERAVSNEIAWQEGLLMVQQIAALEPSAWPAWRELVRDDFHHGNFAPAAEQRAKKLIELAPWTPDGYINLGMRHYQQSEYGPGAAYFKRGLIRAIYGYEDSETTFLCGRTTLFLAAAHVAAGDRVAALLTLERALIVTGHWESELPILLNACWIKATSAQATTRDAEECTQILQYVLEKVQSKNSIDPAYTEQMHLTAAVVQCLTGDFKQAQAEYDPIAQSLAANPKHQCKLRFMAEFQRLGESIKKRQRFVTDYVPVVPQWD